MSRCRDCDGPLLSDGARCSDCEVLSDAKQTVPQVVIDAEALDTALTLADGGKVFEGRVVFLFSTIEDDDD